jgi:hypothetical protein
MKKINYTKINDMLYLAIKDIIDNNDISEEDKKELDSYIKQTGANLQKIEELILINKNILKECDTIIKEGINVKRDS